MVDLFSTLALAAIAVPLKPSPSTTLVLEGLPPEGLMKLNTTLEAASASQSPIAPLLNAKVFTPLFRYTFTSIT